MPRGGGGERINMIHSKANTHQLQWFSTVWKVSVFGVILVRISPYSVRMRENVNPNNSEYGHFFT